MADLEKLLCTELKRQLVDKVRGGAQVPVGGDLLWRWFMDLTSSRTYHMSGPNPISYTEIAAYARATCWPIEPRHIAILRAMDRVYLELAHQRAAAAPDGVKVLPPVSATPLSAGMLDAMFGG
jgi:hypothetical protein